MAFVSAGYSSLTATFPTEPSFSARLHTVDGARVASGTKDFDHEGRPNAGLLVLGSELIDTTLERLAMGLFFIPLALAIWAPGKRANLALLLIVALYYPVMALVGLTT